MCEHNVREVYTNIQTFDNIIQDIQDISSVCTMFEEVHKNSINYHVSLHLTMVCIYGSSIFVTLVELPFHILESIHIMYNLNVGIAMQVFAIQVTHTVDNTNLNTNRDTRLTNPPGLTKY